MAGKLDQARIDRANEEAVARLVAADPVWVDVVAAREAIPGLSDRTILHSGPPVSWERMVDTQKGAVIGAALFEGLAGSADEARAMAERGEIELGSAHEHDAVGPGTGAISASMAVFVVENRTHGNRASCPLQDIQFAFGANDPDTIGRLRWLSDVLGPALQDAVRRLGGIPLKPIGAQSLHMGDEGHDRVAAASALTTRLLAPQLARADLDRGRLVEILDYLGTDIMADWIFESPWMAASKSMLGAAHGIEHSTVVTAMAGNGSIFGVRVSGLGDEWFVAPAPKLHGVFFEGYTADDALEEMGDSVINDTAGFGGPALAAAPAYMPSVGKRPAEGIEITKRMYEITVGRNKGFTIPALDFAGIPAGFDVQRIVAKGILPVLAAGIGHRVPGKGFIGLGLCDVPMECFTQALEAFERRYGS